MDTSDKYYPWLIVAVALVTVAGAHAVIILSHRNTNMNTILLVIGFMTPTITSLLGLLKSHQNGIEIQESRKDTNGRLTELVAVTAKASEAEVHAAGLKEAQLEAAPTRMPRTSPENQR